MHNYLETKQYLNACSGAIRNIFKSFESLRDLVKKQTDDIRQINEQKNREISDFMNWGQWQDQANSFFSNMNQRVKVADALIAEIDRKTEELRISKDLTDDCFAILGGSTLQMAKQTISYRFGARVNIPATLKKAGSQNIGHVIWEGRNNALHWEEGNPSQNVIDVFNALNSDFSGVNLLVTENSALKILDILGWARAENVIADLEEIIL